jgi:tetratricopeptide (TPR) repeat protein
VNVAQNVKPRVFVSFARTQGGAVSRLFAHLRSQALDVWTYDRPSDSIPLTHALEEHLNQQLAESKLFVALVSCDSFNNPFTQWEVSRALELHQSGMLEIAVLVDEKVEQTRPREDRWPGPYEKLQKFRYATVAFDQIASIGQGVHEVCAAIQIEYVPYLEEKGRVLVLSRFYQEMLSAVPRKDARENDTFVYLIRLLEAVHQAFAEGNETAVTQYLQLCLLYTAKEYPGTLLYHGRILHALLTARAGQPRKGLDTLLEMQQETPPESSRKSGLMPAALGYCYYQVGNYRLALDQYVEAAKYHDVDVSTAANMLLCRLRLGEPVNLPNDFAMLEKARNYNEDGPLIQFTIAIAYRLKRQFLEALNALNELLKEPLPRFPTLPEILEERVHVLMKLGRYQRAEETLTTTGKAFLKHPRIIRSLAWVYKDMGKLLQAQKLWRELVENRPTDPEANFEAIAGLWNAGARPDALKYARQYLDRVPWPGEPFAFYVAGMAQWVLGEPTRANYDFSRSGQTRHYREILRE